MTSNGDAYVGTAGLMLDFSSGWSFFSRMVLSELTMRRVAIVVSFSFPTGGLGEGNVDVVLAASSRAAALRNA